LFVDVTQCVLTACSIDAGCVELVDDVQFPALGLSIFASLARFALAVSTLPSAALLSLLFLLSIQWFTAADY
jgi:hypothetical protein